MHSYDDHEHLSRVKRFMTWLSPFFMFLSFAAFINYFVWRNKATVDAQRQDNKVYWLAWFFIGAEAIIAGKLCTLLRERP